jgi:hypothetical protein
MSSILLIDYDVGGLFKLELHEARLLHSQCTDPFFDINSSPPSSMFEHRKQA